MKRALVGMLCLAMLLTGGWTVLAEGAQTPEDVAFAMQVTQTIADLGDNPDIGNRSSGSAAERQAAEFIEKTMKEIGLQNVTVDSFTADTWSFNRGRVYYTDAQGQQQHLVLGGFATQLKADMQEVSLVYAGRGTAQDYEGLDVKGKVVLIDINQAEDWWISVPAYEAYTRGALCVLACNVDGYAYYDKDTIGSQDICGPEYAAAFSLSQNSAGILKALIQENGGEAQVILDVESIVEKDGSSQNVWGEIPGETDEVIYYFAHYDGYYHSYFDDASGVGTMLAIAKNMVESGLKPDKTIRFVAHGAEEWGKADTEYDWSKGAYAQITEVHPEWAETAFAILNIDGMNPVKGHTAYSVAATYELKDFTEQVALPLYADGAYDFQVNAPTNCWTEDFSYVRAGVPSIVASYEEPRSLYRGSAYHSSMDNVVLGVDEAAWARNIQLFTAFALELDKLAARPVDFEDRFEAMAESYQGQADIEGIRAAARQLKEAIDQLNADYAAALEAGDDQAAQTLRDKGIALDQETHLIFKDAVAATAAFDWEDNTVFPYEVTSGNIAALEGAIDALEQGDAALALDEYLYNVDYNWYAYDFSQETYTYLLDKMYNKAEGTWGEGMIRRPGEDLWEEIHSLKDKIEAGQTDFAAEIEALEQALERQQGYAAELDEQMVSDVDSLTQRITQAAAGV